MFRLIYSHHQADHNNKGECSQLHAHQIADLTGILLRKLQKGRKQP